MEVQLHFLLSLFFIAALSSSLAEEAVALSSSGDARLYEASASSLALSAAQQDENLWGVALHPETYTLYTTAPTSGKIYALDWANLAAGSTAVVTDSTAVYHGLTVFDGFLYVLNSQTDSLQRYALPIQADAVPDTICDGYTRPNEVSIYENTILVTDSGADAIYVHALATGTLLATIPFNGAWGVAVNPVDGVPYIASYDDGTIVSLDLALETLTPVASGLDGPRGLEFDRFGTLYVYESNANRLVTVNPADGSIAPTTYTGATRNGHDFLVVETLDLDGDFLPDSWERTYAASLESIDSRSDSDNDSLNALAEYAFGRSPASTTGKVTVRETWDLEGSNTILVDTVNDTNIRVHYQVSNDLLSWSSVSVTSSEAAPVAGLTRQSVTFDTTQLYPTAPSNLFFRAMVEPNR